jgi:TonB family protein
MKRTAYIPAFLIGAYCLILFNCGAPKDPGRRPLVIVSSDTLTVADIAIALREYQSGDTAASESLSTQCADSLRNRTIQGWIDRKLILRQARTEQFEYDSSCTSEAQKIAAFCLQVKNENMVTKWDVNAYKAEQKENGTEISSEHARRQLELNKLVAWKNELRKKGGYLILDEKISDGPLVIPLVLPNGDSTADVLGIFLKKELLLSLSQEIAPPPVYHEVLDSMLLNDLKKIEAGAGTTADVAGKKKESQAHLYRKPESLQKTIKSYLPTVEDCYQKEIKRNPSMQGKIVVQMIISEDGSVSSVQVLQAAFMDEQFFEKIDGIIKTWKFPAIPARAGELTVNYPFDFKAAE